MRSVYPPILPPVPPGAIVKVGYAKRNRGWVTYGAQGRPSEWEWTYPANEESDLAWFYGPYVRNGEGFAGFVVCQGSVQQAVLKVYVNGVVVAQSEIRGWDRFFMQGYHVETSGGRYVDVVATITPTTDTTLSCRSNYAYGRVYGQGEVPFDAPVEECRGEMRCGSRIVAYPISELMIGYHPFDVTLTIDGADYVFRLLDIVEFPATPPKFAWSSKSVHVEKIMLIEALATIDFDVPDGVLMLANHDNGTGYSTLLICSGRDSLNRSLPYWTGGQYSEDAYFILVAIPGAKEIRGCVALTGHAGDINPPIE